MVIGAAAGLSALGIGGPAGLALSGMALAIKGLYRIPAGINEFFDHHIDQMKKSDNNTVSQTGCVIESAKHGFGLGYMSSVVIIAAGQFLLGNHMAAAATVATAVTLSNPIAMTCAAVGAIYYGWSALSAQEQANILDKLTKGLEIGAELIKSIIKFLITTTKELLSSENIAEFKRYIKSYAAKFGKSLYDVTGKMTDLVKDAAEKTGELTSQFADTASTAVKEAMDKTGQAASHAADATSSALKIAFEKTGDAASSAALATSIALKDAIEKTGDAAGSLSTSTKQALGWKKNMDPVKTDSQDPT